MKKLVFLSVCPILVLILSFWAIRPLLNPGFISMHDDTQPARIFEMAKSLSFGQLPVRWVPDLGFGFGYPLYNFYAPLPYYIGGVFNLLGIEAITATKIMFFIGIMLSGISMYILVEKIAGRIPAVVAAILYIYTPYHAVDIYIRGAVGEFYALGFLPFILLGIYTVMSFKSNRSLIYQSRSLITFIIGLSEERILREGIVLGSFATAGVLLSHNVIGMITVFFWLVGLFLFLIYKIIQGKPNFMFFSLIIMVILGFGLSAFFTIPALVEKKYTRVEELTVGGSDFHKHFVYPDQLWNSTWGFGGSAPGREDGLSFKIGKLQILLGIIAISLLLYMQKLKKITIDRFYFFLVIILILSLSLFLMLGQSLIIWEIIPLFPYIQYPWRFLSFTIMCLSVLSTVIFILFKKNIQIILGFLIVSSTLILNVKYFQPREYKAVKEQDYTSEINLKFNISQVSNEYMPPDFEIPRSLSEIAWQAIPTKNKIFINQLQDTPTMKIYQIYLIAPSKILTNIASFPGWEAKIDNQALNLFSNNGRLEINLPAGMYQLKLKLSDTPVRFAANTISIFTFFLILYVSLLQGKLNIWRKKFR